MKRIFNNISIAVAMSAAIFVSCQKEVENVITPEEDVVKKGAIASLTFSISDNEATKTVIAEDEGKKYAAWESGDAIGYVTSKTDKGSANVTLGTPDKFTITPATGLDINDKLYVWYPYRRDETSQASINMIIPVSQIQAGDSFDFDAMPLVAEPIEIESSMLSGDDYDGTIAFANLASLIEFKVFSSDPTYASEKVAAITFDAGSTNIAGHFNFDVSSVDFETSSSLEISGYTGKSVTTSLASPVTIGTDKASARNVYMVVAPGTYTGNIIVATDAAFYTIPISGKEFERSGFKSFGLDLGKNVATRRSIKGSFIWQLDQVSYSSASSDAAIWPYGLITMAADKASASTNTNNYLPPFQASGSAANNSRFYKNSTLTFTPSSLWIEKVEFTAGSTGYASALSSASSTWINATATADETTVTIVPLNGSSPFSAVVGGTTGGTAMKVYFNNTDYTVSKATVSNGTLSVDKATAKVNEVITVTATPDTGYALSGISVKDESDNDIALDGTTFRMPASNVTVSATFTAASSAKAIHITTPSNGTVVTDPNGSATAGATVTITATPNDGYGVNMISVVDEDSNPVVVTNNQFTMPNKEVTVTVTFVKTYVLTCSSKNGNSSYSTYYTVTQGGISWKAPGNQALGEYWQIGGLKKAKGAAANTDTRYICMTGDNTLDFDVSTITVYTNGLNNTNLVINSITVTAHNSADDAQSGDNEVATFTTSATLTFAANTDKDLVYTKSGTTDCTGKYFRIAINATNDYTTNYGLKVKSVKFQ